MIFAGKFVTVTNCLERLVQENISSQLKEKNQLGYIDLINEAGQISAPAEGELDYLVDSIFEPVKISERGNISSLMTIFVHNGCIGNFPNEETRLERNQRGKKQIFGRQLNIEAQLLLANRSLPVHRC